MKTKLGLVFMAVLLGTIIGYAITHPEPAKPLFQRLSFQDCTFLAEGPLEFGTNDLTIIDCNFKIIIDPNEDGIILSGFGAYVAGSRFDITEAQ